jgi:hypothetical protein
MPADNGRKFITASSSCQVTFLQESHFMGKLDIQGKKSDRQFKPPVISIMMR